MHSAGAIGCGGILRRSALLWAVCAGVLGNTACEAPGGRRERDDATLIIHVANQDERVLGPLGANPWFLVFLGLVTDPEAIGTDATEDPQPRLLASWEHTPDYTEWTAYVRPGLQWDDGVPVTARDVKFSLDLWTHPDVGYEYRFYDTLTVVDSLTLHFTYSQPDEIMVYSWLAMLPAHLLDTLDIDDLFSWPFWIQPIGNGPYRYVRHIPNTMVELAANPAYYGRPPRIPRVMLRFGGHQVTELLSGSVDIATGVPPIDAARLDANPRFQTYHRVRYVRSLSVIWNHRNPLFASAAIRRALTLAIDRHELHQVLYFPDEVPVYDVPTLRRHHRRGTVPAPLPHDTAAAARLLREAGWIDTDGDGVRENGEREFRFTLIATEAQSAQAVYLQEQFRRIGVRMDVATLQRAVLRQRVRGADFDAGLEAYNFVEQFGDRDPSGFFHPELQGLRDAIWYEIDREQRDTYLQRVWEIVAAEIPITYLHPELEYVVAHRRVKGLQHNRDLFPNVEHLWLAGDDTAQTP
jgi:peptide/nickel transport system substrate-binding protein